MYGTYAHPRAGSPGVQQVPLALGAGTGRAVALRAPRVLQVDCRDVAWWLLSPYHGASPPGPERQIQGRAPDPAEGQVGGKPRCSAETKDKAGSQGGSGCQRD